MDHQEVIMWMWTRFMWFRTMYREHNNGSSIKYRKCLDELSHYQMLNAVNFLKLGYQMSSLL